MPFPYCTTLKYVNLQRLIINLKNKLTQNLVYLVYSVFFYNLYYIYYIIVSELL